MALRLGFDPFQPNLTKTLSNGDIAQRLNISEGRVSQLFKEGSDLISIDKSIRDRLLHNHPELAHALKRAERKDSEE